MNSNQPPSNFLLTTIHIVRMIGELLRSLQSDSLSPETLAAFDSHFASCQAVFPPHCQIYHPQPLEPRHLAAICQLQNCRIVLHRHNLSTSSSYEVRHIAIANCVQAAKETVHLLQRVRQYQPPAPLTWSDAVASATSTMVCTHIWRCMLFLLFSALYDEALICIDICTAIGNFRSVNIACGRFVYGFLRALETRQNTDLLRDEMIMALVSGDLQGSTESSWAWNGSETGTQLMNQSSAPPPGKVPKKEMMPRGEATTLSEGEKEEWGGWKGVADMIHALKREKEKKTAASTEGNTGSSRISIANII